jgi:hypothetical protein
MINYLLLQNEQNVTIIDKFDGFAVEYDCGHTGTGAEKKENG